MKKIENTRGYLEPQMVIVNANVASTILTGSPSGSTEEFTEGGDLNELFG